jgi:hypothetical protein
MLFTTLMTFLMFAAALTSYALALIFFALTSHTLIFFALASHAPATDLIQRTRSIIRNRTWW